MFCHFVSGSYSDSLDHMNDKQKNMYEWLMDRILFAMDQGDLTELHCLTAVTDADERLKEINDDRKKMKGKTNGSSIS